ncbi:MAG: glutamate--tRNA ligase family protein, partial [Alphaproteobacteria bacterium]
AVDAALDRGSLAFWEAFVLGTEIEVICTPKQLGDVVLARKDLGASYHLAVVFDDAAQGVNLVTRGKDLLEATHIHVLLQRLLDLPTPVYGHHALVLDEAGKRLAKRDKARSLSELRANGWTVEDVRRALPPPPDYREALATLTRRYSR